MLRPDFETICVAPGYKTPTAFVFADSYNTTGEPYDIAPRYVLRKVHEALRGRGPKADGRARARILPHPGQHRSRLAAHAACRPLRAARRRRHSRTGSRPSQSTKIIIETIYEHAEAASLHLDTMIHESGTAQLEINFNHGDPVHVSDQVLVFKRIVRQVALKHGVYATFMAKPHGEPTWFSDASACLACRCEEGAQSFRRAARRRKRWQHRHAFRHFVGGLQKYLGDATPLFAPNVNSFRRMRPDFSAPINLQWGYDNRSCGLRVPISQP